MTLQPVSDRRPLPQALWRQAPLFRFALAAVAGIALAWAARGSVSAAWWAVAAVVCALAGVWGFARAAKQRALSAEKKYFKVLCLVWLSTLFVFALLTRLHSQQVFTSFPTDSRLWVGRVEDVSKVRDSTLTLTVRLTDDNAKWDGKRVTVRLSREDGDFNSGETIAFCALMRTGREGGNPGNFNYGNYLATHHLSGTAFVPKGAVRKLSTGGNANGVTSLFGRWRKVLEREYSALFSQTETALLAALTLGDKAMLADDTRDLFSSTGTSHVLALSGLHLGILFSVFNFLVLARVRSRRSRLCVTAALFVLVWTYALLAGSPLSLLRAAAMLSLMLVGEALQRSRRSSVNNLSLAALVLLFLDPLALFDVGFQLSFVAVFSIIVVQQYVWQCLPLPLWVDPPWAVRRVDDGEHGSRRKGLTLLRVRSELFPALRNGLARRAYNLLRNVVVPFAQVSLSAQWGTLPLVLYYFHQLTPYALVANFVVVPLAYVLLVGALLFFALPVPGLKLLLAKGLQAVISVLTASLGALSSWPLATVKVYQPLSVLLAIWALPVAMYGFFVHRERRVRRRWMAAFFVVLLGVATECVVTNALVSRRAMIAVYKLPQATVLHFVDGRERAFLVSSVSADSTKAALAYVRSNYFEPQRMPEPRFVDENRMECAPFARSGNFMLFHGKRVYWLHCASIETSRSAGGKRPKVDVLVVSGGCYADYGQVSRVLQPAAVVLAPTLSQKMRKRWTEQCRKAGVPLHDVRTGGAYVLSFPR